MTLSVWEYLPRSLSYLRIRFQVPVVSPTGKETAHGGRISMANRRHRSHVLHDSDAITCCWDRPLRTEKEAQQVARS